MNTEVYCPGYNLILGQLEQVVCSFICKRLLDPGQLSLRLALY